MNKYSTNFELTLITVNLTINELFTNSKMFYFKDIKMF